MIFFRTIPGTPTFWEFYVNLHNMVVKSFVFENFLQLTKKGQKPDTLTLNLNFDSQNRAKNI